MTSELAGEGGVWVSTQDPAQLECVRTETFCYWYEDVETGELAYISTDEDWLANHIYIGCDPCDCSQYSEWEFDNITTETRWPEEYFEHEVNTDYYNWTWGCDDLQTTVDQVVMVGSNVNNDSYWLAHGYHGGEDAGLLHWNSGWKNNP